MAYKAYKKSKAAVFSPYDAYKESITTSLLAYKAYKKDKAIFFSPYNICNGNKEARLLPYHIYNENKEAGLLAYNLCNTALHASLSQAKQKNSGILPFGLHCCYTVTGQPLTSILSLLEAKQKRVCRAFNRE